MNAAADRQLLHFTPDARQVDVKLPNACAPPRNRIRYSDCSFKPEVHVLRRSRVRRRHPGLDPVNRLDGEI